MKITLRHVIVSFIAFSAFILSYKPKNDNSELTQNTTTEIKVLELNQDEEYIKTTINALLFHAGNYNITALNSMVSNKAILGISRLKDGTWSNSEIAINDYF